MRVACLAATYSRHNIKHCINPGPDRGRRNSPASAGALVPAKTVVPTTVISMERLQLAKYAKKYDVMR